MDSFLDAQLAEPLLRGIAKAGFEQPTPVQTAVIPVALEGHDLMAAAATGSGKTAAFLLPIMQQLLESPAPRAGTRALVLVPTRELASQVLDHFHAVGSYSRLTAAVIVGGDPRNHQVNALRRNPEILIATPGRLREHLETGEADLSDLAYLVLDEADRMLDMGLVEDVFAIIQQAPAERQSMLFSATLHRRGVAELAEHLLRDPLTITLDHHRSAHPDIDHQVILADDPAHKARLLHRLLETADYQRALVFSNTRDGAEQAATRLADLDIRCAVLHGELDQRERKRVMGLFRDGTVPVLVASDVAARGLDVPGVELVVNLDVPRSGDDYLHRSGRTGRAGRRGLTVTLVGAPEWNRMAGIERYLGLSVGQVALAGLEARFQGAPKRGKPIKKATKKRAAKGAAGKVEAKPKTKQRLRDRKNIGKRRQPSNGAGAKGPEGTPAGQGVEAGFDPPKRRG
ncbi:MAG: DEAD/DEAH box helicase [Thiohalocapsa sp.]|jgi:superfamily II DNA/RNA helicase|uniref:DEAD/DEAH box helicase n=1 Tax=Thiohalocapsa sp. TaxID=2497641 RepID=UPI0025F9AD21|nr:DEAD/DEAH box helicase [Thiohalocapsa sp.]MCG6943519.1 DEAD/DEAH box helicase [Thiohalocapsa sp.]